MDDTPELQDLFLPWHTATNTGVLGVDLKGVCGHGAVAAAVDGVKVVVRIRQSIRDTMHQHIRQKVFHNDCTSKTLSIDTAFFCIDRVSPIASDLDVSLLNTCKNIQILLTNAVATDCGFCVLRGAWTIPWLRGGSLSLPNTRSLRLLVPR